MDLSPGARFGGRFELRGELGRGAMGVVYRAREVASGRDVALKLVRGRAGDPRLAYQLQRFKREAELTAALPHPGIVRVHSAGEVDGVGFIAYELIESCTTLEDLLARGGLDLEARVRLVREAAVAVGFAHERGVLHRDLKPANVLVDGAGRARVADFGLATASGLDRLTQSGTIVGTPSFMAPEQITGGVATAATDVWALGVMLYLALTGSLPFEAESLAELSARVCSQRPVAPRERAPEVPRPLEAVCLRALSTAPEGRFPDAGAFAAALERAAAGEQPRSGLRRAGAAAALALAGLLLLAGARGWRAQGHVPVAEKPPVTTRAPARSAVAPALRDAVLALEPTIGAAARDLVDALEAPGGAGPLPQDERAGLVRLLFVGGASAEAGAAARGLRAAPGLRGPLARALHACGLAAHDRGDARGGDDLLEAASTLGTPAPEHVDRVVARWLLVAEEAVGGAAALDLAAAALSGDEQALSRLTAVLDVLARAQRAAPERDLLSAPESASRFALTDVIRNMDRAALNGPGRDALLRLAARTPDDPCVCFALASVHRIGGRRSTPEAEPYLRRALAGLVQARAGAGESWAELHAEVVDRLVPFAVASGRPDEARALIDEALARSDSPKLSLAAADYLLMGGRAAVAAGDLASARALLLEVDAALGRLDDGQRERFSSKVAELLDEREQLAASVR